MDQAQHALHFEFSDRDGDQFAGFQFARDGEVRNQRYPIAHGHKALDGFNRGQFNPHVQRRAVAVKGLDHAPPCVTAEFKVVLKRPTPMGPIHVDAVVVTATDDRATIEATMTAGGKVTAIGTGTFIAVKPGHPAYHRW